MRNGLQREAKQAAVDQKRFWVRLTRACNNRCIFCHDAGAHDGQAIAFDEVERRLAEGRQDGAERLILSGGEPTIHPRFLDAVSLGRELGYEWIQTVTNGRMFGYRRFAERAWEAGLREATFSMHAHEPALFDRLVGVDGAYRQALAGLVAAIRLGMVVSVDVVLNRLNLPYLKEILEFYMSLGVTEFDLLHLVPFGRGFDEHRDELFPSEEETLAGLGRALDVASRPGVFVWTNRLPVRFLEGHEDLLQDPHKLYDEVLGERDSFREMFATGLEPACLGERCPHCFLRQFCEAAQWYVSRKASGIGRRTSDVGRRPEVEATSAFCAAAAGMTGAELREATAGGLVMPMRESLREATTVTPDLASLLEVARRTRRRVRGLPPCLRGAGDLPRPALDPRVGTAGGAMDLREFVAFFIRRLYRVKSARCSDCRHGAGCQGLPVNVARLWGLGVLAPERATDDNG